MSHMCHGQNLGSSWARAFTGRRFHAILMWWVLCFPECQVPLVGVILCICPTWNWTPDIVLILGTDMGVQTFCAVSGVHCWQHRRNLLWLLLFMENRKPSGAYLQCSHVWLFTSWWIKTVCRVGSRGPMEQTLTVLLPIRNGTKTKWLVSHVSAACAAFGLFHLTLSHYIDSNWGPQNVVTSRHMLYFMPIMSVVSCWCYAFAFNAEGLLCEATHL